MYVCVCVLIGCVTSNDRVCDMCEMGHRAGP